MSCFVGTERLGLHSVALAHQHLDARFGLFKLLAAVVADLHPFLEKREGAWGIVLRQPIYEKDRLDPVDPSATLALDASVLAQFPVGYRHLAYAQTQIGYDVKRDMPGLVGPGVQRLYRRGAEWLAGAELGDPLKTVD